MTDQELKRQFDYNGWANGESLASLRAIGGTPPKALRWMNHIVAVEYLWLDRIRREEQRHAVWPEWSIEECEGFLAKIEIEWSRFLDGLTPNRLSETVAYVNTLGTRYENAVEDVLAHVNLHSAYHRGQVAAEIRAAGGQPAYTDFIHAVREGKLRSR